MQNRKFLTVMLDMSRNGPLKVETIKHFADIAKKMGYNAVGLYMEDVYEIDGEPYFGHLRGRYTKAELKEVNSYLKSIDMTAIPYIQTLAHIGSIFQWSEYSPLRDTRDILLIDEPRTYELIDKMFATMRECFDTDQINIGMDEAGQVGLGSYLHKHGYKENRVELLYHHLQKVLEIAKKYNFKPTMWADLFFSLPTNGKDLKEFIADYRFIQEQDIHTVADLQANIDKSRAQLSELERERKTLSNRIRRPKSPEDESKNKERRKAISRQMKPVCEKLRRAEKILKKSPHLYELLKQEHELERKARARYLDRSRLK